MFLRSIKSRLLSLLVGELESYIPQFEPRALDYQIVNYALRDLEVWMENNWDAHDQRTIYEKLSEHLDKEYEDFRVFLNFWVGRWFEKWRERVKVLSTKPKVPPHHLERVMKAKELYREMPWREELKKMVVRKLVSKGEICMAELIAENLITEEIAKRIRIMGGDSKYFRLDPLDILNKLSRTISRLPEEKGPLVYLRIKTYTFF
jgi:hypothetical protein